MKFSPSVQVFEEAENQRKNDKLVWSENTDIHSTSYTTFPLHLKYFLSDYKDVL